MMVDLRLREARNNSGLRPPDDATRSVTDKAASRLSGAKKAVEMYRKQLDDRQTALEMSRMSTLHLLILPQGFPGFIHRSVYLEAELEKLQIQLGAKRRVGLLLGVLERKESLRVKRFEEITRLLDKLRCARDFCEGLHYCDTYILVC